MKRFWFFWPLECSLEWLQLPESFKSPPPNTHPDTQTPNPHLTPGVKHQAPPYPTEDVHIVPGVQEQGCKSWREAEEAPLAALPCLQGPRRGSRGPSYGGTRSQSSFSDQRWALLSPRGHFSGPVWRILGALRWKKVTPSSPGSLKTVRVCVSC